MFNIDMQKFLTLLLPTFLRKKKRIALIRCYCFPLMVIYQNFMAFREWNLYRINHNSQVVSMENVFNDRFDNEQRRIYITNGFGRERKYMYTRAENRPLYLGTQYLYNRGDYADTGIDFIVWVPTAILLTPQDKIELTSLINNYRLPTKRFKIYRV